MLQSRPIEIEGRFVGVAVRANIHGHVVPVDPALEDLNGLTFCSAEEAEHMVRLVRHRAQHTPRVASPGGRYQR